MLNNFNQTFFHGVNHCISKPYQFFIALCVKPLRNLEIKNLQKMMTLAPIFSSQNYFRWKYLEVFSFAVSLSIYIWVRVEKSLLQQQNLLFWANGHFSQKWHICIYFVPKTLCWTKFPPKTFLGNKQYYIDFFCLFNFLFLIYERESGQRTRFDANITSSVHVNHSLHKVQTLRWQRPILETCVQRQTAFNPCERCDDPQQWRHPLWIWSMRENIWSNWKSKGS